MLNMNFIIAVVDDDQRMVESLGELLESAGHTVHGFSSARTLLSSAAFSEIDCLITDIGMQDMDGFELRRTVNEKRPNLPVILITGRHEFAELSQARHTLFFRKPFDGQELLAAIGAAVRGKERPP